MRVLSDEDSANRRPTADLEDLIKASGVRVPTVDEFPRPALACDMIENCQDPVTHIDAKGYAYCTKHGKERQAYQRCRKLTPAELKRLQSGEPLTRY